MLPQTASAQQAEATAFFIIIVIALLILYVYYGWYVPIRDLKDKSKPKFKPIATLFIALIPLGLIAWAIIDEIRRVAGLRSAAAAAPPPQVEVAMGTPAGGPVPPPAGLTLPAQGGVTYKTA